MIPFDHALFEWVVAHRFSVVNGLMWGLSAIGRGGIVWFLIAAVLTLLRRFRPHELAQLAVVLLITSAIVDRVLKPAIGRVRPFAGTSAVQIIGGAPSTASFPSGHAANAFAGAWTLTRLAPGAALWRWVLAIAIAFSRVYLGVHYPLDVMGGALVGVACAALVQAGVSRWSSKSEGAASSTP